MADSTIYDALIIGGGPAGLSASLPIIRQQFSVVIFDEGKSPIDPSKRLHLIPSWDHQDKDLFATSAKDNLSRYETLRFERTTIERVRKVEKYLFEVEDSKGQKWKGKKVVLANGVRYILPDIEGYADCWGKGIYRCCFCNAFEDRGANSVGVLAVDGFASVPMALHAAQDFKRFAKQVTIYTHGSESLAEELAAAITNPEKVKIKTSKIKLLDKTGAGGECTVHLEDGSSHVEGFLGHIPATKPNGPFVEDLGVELDEQGDVKAVPPLNATNVHGVYVAGDLCSFSKITSHAFYLGNIAGAGVAEELLAES
ncbi:thioredoxin reductase glit [Aaosphaeria arxii CBS 175.79]|uniref:Thioredoxin reductase glit n=1 Tax=Aaosphaeria arxii CBS 175.79 TaxID=1450172 RepID=A0A6A5XNB4_9PLEO|nr:thioredoxin reductase glit [Aaosphaeria arxii CBS 175.79]KAF2014413.1 thioredoxin reductase glit [Aaosphaeria arxii CBS 175.79]